ncbi:hypothetical protein [Nocardia asteroides]|uniref:hypothetical protein n=1 Tax=Nocardia asteroides TaxID=1824 RepID=UPI001E333C1B|nr:hypothetical protein [Nocardia asteroides]UGT64426.1 hypothetical protein LTT61_14545 [Nocardia asteroides]
MVSASLLDAAANELAEFFPPRNAKMAAFKMECLESLQALPALLGQIIPIEEIDVSNPAQVYDVLVAIDRHARDNPTQDRDKPGIEKSSTTNIVQAVGVMIRLYDRHGYPTKLEERWQQAMKIVGYDSTRHLRGSGKLNVRYRKIYVKYIQEILSDPVGRRRVLSLNVDGGVGSSAEPAALPVAVLKAEFDSRSGEIANRENVEEGTARNANAEPTALPPKASIYLFARRSSGKLLEAEVRYRVESNDRNLGPLRLFLDYFQTGDPSRVFAGIRVAIQVGVEVLTEATLTSQIRGDSSSIRLKHVRWSRGTADTPLSEAKPLDLEIPLRREGLIIDKISRDEVSEGVLLLHLIRESQSLRVNKYAFARNVKEYTPLTRELVISQKWALEVEAQPDTIVDFMVRAHNNSVDTMWDMMIGDNLPDYLAFVPGSTILFAGNNVDGKPISSDNVCRGGINIGSYGPDSVAYILFSTRINQHRQFAKLGTYRLRNVGIARPGGYNEVYNTAQVNVNIRWPLDAEG